MQNNFPKISFSLSLIFLFLCFFSFIFLYKLTNDSHKESQMKELEWQAEAGRREDVEALEHSIKVIEKESKELENHFAKSSDIVPFLDTVEDLAFNVGIKAEVTTVDVPKEITNLVLGMTVSGEFDSIYKFITLLENSSYELEFISMEMHKESTPESSTGEGGNIIVKMPKWRATLMIRLLSFVK